MSLEAETMPSPSCYFSPELSATIYHKGKCVLCLAPTFTLEFTLPVMLPEMILVVDTILQHSIQADWWPPPSRLLELHLWHFLSCALKHQFVFSRPPLKKRLDLYQPLWHMAGIRWWLSRRPPWIPPIQQMTAITPSNPLRRTSCCRLQPSLVASPEAMIWNSRSFINASSIIQWLWCLNNWTSAGENENKFNRFLLIHSMLVIFQPLSVCRGLRVFQWQHVEPPAEIWANC